MDNLLKKLKKLNLIRNFTILLKVTLLPLIIFAAAFALLQFINGEKLISATWIFSGMTAAACIIQLGARYFYREKLMTTAQIVDREYHAFNRMECALELQKDFANPLAAAQQAEAEKFFTDNKFRIRKRRFLPYLLINLLLWGLIIFFALRYGDFTWSKAAAPQILQQLLNNSDSTEGNPDELTPEDAANNDSATPPALPEEPEFITTLQLYEPAEESNAQRYESIHWRGGASSNGELKNLTLHIHRNGDQLQVIPLNTMQLDEKNIVKVEGELDLVDLDLKDYDLLAVYLAATVKYPSGEEANLISPIHFIGILPLNEDKNDENEAEDTPPPDGDEQPGEKLRQVMRKQMDLHKGITALRISRQYRHNDQANQHILMEEIRKDQAELNNTIRKIINSGELNQAGNQSINELKAALPHLEQALRLVDNEKMSIPEDK